MLHAALAGQEEPRLPESWVHASDVTSEELRFCPRQWFLMRRDGLRPRARSSHAAQGFSHRMGHLYQDLVTDLLGGAVFGTWRCPCGRVEELSRRPGKCPGCGAAEWRHVETRFVSRRAGISVGIDVLVDVGLPRLKVVEVKGLKPDEFRSLVMPKAEHRLRTALYLRVVADSPTHLRRMVDTDSALVLYVAKGGWGVRDDQVPTWKVAHDSSWSPFKEYEVRRDDVLTKGPWADGAALVKAQKAGKAPPRTCGTQMDRRALACCSRAPCFAEE